jgi:hypothetical protein
MIFVKDLIPFLFIALFLNFINCLAKNNCCDQCLDHFLCLDCICKCGDGYFEANKSCVRKQLHCISDSDCGSDGSGVCNSNKCECNENHEWNDEHKCSQNSSVGYSAGHSVGHFENNTILKEIFIESIEYVIIIGIVLILVLMACIYRIIVSVLKKKKSVGIEMSRSHVIKV